MQPRIETSSSIAIVARSSHVKIKGLKRDGAVSGTFQNHRGCFGVADRRVRMTDHHAGQS